MRNKWKVKAMERADTLKETDGRNTGDCNRKRHLLYRLQQRQHTDNNQHSLEVIRRVHWHLALDTHVPRLNGETEVSEVSQLADRLHIERLQLVAGRLLSPRPVHAVWQLDHHLLLLGCQCRTSVGPSCNKIK